MWVMIVNIQKFQNEFDTHLDNTTIELSVKFQSNIYEMREHKLIVFLYIIINRHIN